jgi:hypothetical protein
MGALMRLVNTGRRFKPHMATFARLEQTRTAHDWSLESLLPKELHKTLGLVATPGWRNLGLAHAEEIAAGLGVKPGVLRHRIKAIHIRTCLLDRHCTYKDCCARRDR